MTFLGNLRILKKISSILGLTIVLAVISPPNSSQNVKAQSTSVHFAVIGDYGYEGQPEADVATLVNSWNPDFIVTTGDNNYGGVISAVTYPPGSSETIDTNIGQYYQGFIYPYTGIYGSGANFK